MILHDAIANANRAGRRGLILYAIPGYPDVDTYESVVDLMEENDEISILETTIPVTSGFSAHANDVIREAHRIASRNLMRAAPRQRPFAKPRLAVLYRATVEAHGVAAALALLRGNAEGLLLEWDEHENTDSYREAAAHAGIELVECVGPWMTEGEIGKLLKPTSSNPLVYLMSAAGTGAALYSTKVIADCIGNIRRHRPAAKIAAGFGISGPEQIRVLRRVEGLDAVIIGTAWLRAMASGTEKTRAYLAQITEAL